MQKRSRAARLEGCSPANFLNKEGRPNLVTASARNAQGSRPASPSIACLIHARPPPSNPVVARCTVGLRPTSELYCLTAKSAHRRLASTPGQPIVRVALRPIALRWAIQIFLRGPWNHYENPTDFFAYQIGRPSKGRHWLRLALVDWCSHSGLNPHFASSRLQLTASALRSLGSGARFLRIFLWLTQPTQPHLRSAFRQN
jgi:hypothetical protein